MDIKQISPTVAAAGQIFPADIKRLAQMGFKTLINNRPENEVAEQPSLAELKAEAEKHGMVLKSVPITPGAFTEQNIQDFNHALEQSETPVLAYCRSGMRSTTMWAFNQARHRDVAEIVRIAAANGYDISAHRDRLNGIAAGAR